MSRQNLLRVLGIMNGRSGGPAPIDWLLRDEFLTDETAPIATPRTDEPGPGTWGVVQNDGQMSITGEQLVIPAQTTPVWNDLSIYSTVGYTRTPGLALMMLVNFSAMNPFILGWGAASNGNYDITQVALTHSAFGREFYTNSSIQRPRSAITTGVERVIVLILRATGAYYFEGLTLYAVGYQANAATLYPKFANFNAALTMDYARVAQLGGNFATDTLTVYSDATPVSNDTATAGADALHYIQWTVGASEVFELRVRYTDDDNCLIMRCDQAGSTFRIFKRVAAVETQLATTAVTWTVGVTHRLAFRYDGNLLSVWGDGTASSLAATDGYNASVTGAKVMGAATLANWDIYPVLLTGADADELTRHTDPFLSV